MYIGALDLYLSPIYITILMYIGAQDLYLLPIWLRRVADVCLMGIVVLLSIFEYMMLACHMHL